MFFVRCDTRVANTETILASWKCFARTGEQEAQDVLPCRDPGGGSPYLSVPVEINRAQFFGCRLSVPSALSGASARRLCVFSCSSREEMHEQLGRENTGRSSTSVTAAQFLHERLIDAPGVIRGTPADEGGADQQRASNAIAKRPPVQIRSREANSLVGRHLSAMERRRLELELGPGGNHDVPYRFALPPSMPQVLVWVKLLAKVAYGELQP